MAPGGFDGTIRVDTRVDSKGFNQGIKGIMGSLKKVGAAVGIAFGVAAVVNFGKSAVGAAGEMAAALTGLQSVLNGQGRSWSQAQQMIKDYTADGLVPATNAIKAYQNLALRGYSDTQIKQTLDALKDSAAFGRRGGLSMGDAIQTATEGLRNENSILVDNAGVTKNVAKMWEDYAKKLGTTTAALTKEQKILAEVEGIQEETKFQTGDAAKATQGWTGMIAGLTTSFYNLSVALGNILIPIISQIIPVIKGAVDYLVVLFNTFAQFVSTLLGVDMSMGSVADETQATAEAAGELAAETTAVEDAAKGALAAFDELNVLQEDQAAAPVIGGLEEPALVEPEVMGSDTTNKIQEFKDRALELLQPLTDSLAGLKESLGGLGETVWDGLKWGWENIIKPIGEWVATDAAPLLLDGLAAGADILNNALLALEPLGKWLWENFLKPIGEWTGQVLLDALQWLVDRLEDIGKWIKDNPKAFENFAIILGSLALAWGLVNAAVAIWNWVGGIATAITTGFGTAVAFLTSPIFLVALAIGILIAIIILLVRNWDEVKEAASKVWDWIVEKWGQLSAWFKEKVTDPLANWFKDAWDKVKQFGSDAWEGIKTKATDAWEGIKGIWSGIGEWIRINVTEPIKDKFGTALDWVKEKWETISGGFGDFFKGVVNGIIDFINGLIFGFSEGINSIVSALNSLSITIPEWVPGIGGNSFGVNIPYVQPLYIPRLATGAVIPPNSEFLAMLGDQRSGRNIEAPETLLRQIVAEEIGKIEADIRIEFGGTLGQLVRELKPHIDRENVRIGKSLVSGGVTV